MAAGDDFSLDPLSTEQNILQQQYQEALAAKLRANQPRGKWDVAGAATAAFESGNAAGTISDMPAKQRALSDQYQQSMVEALRGAPPDIQAMAKSPATRSQAIELWKQQKLNDLSNQESERWMSKMPGYKPPGGAAAPTGSPPPEPGTGAPPPGAGTIGAAPSLGAQGAADPNDALYAKWQQQRQVAFGMAGSRDPGTKARGEAMIKAMEPNARNPGVAYTLEGEGVGIPGAVKAYEAQQRAAARASGSGKVTMQPGAKPGEEIPMTEEDAAAQAHGRFVGQPSGQPPALPATLGAGNVAPPVSAPNSAASGPPASVSPPVSAAPTGGVPTDSMSKFKPQIDAAGQKYGVEPSVLRVIGTMESNGDPTAMNFKTKDGHPSIGLFQFQGPTAKQYGIDPRDPNQSIDGAARYLSDLQKKYGGDHTKMLAAYNWGQGNVDKAIQSFGDKWTDHIPAETHKYLDTAAQMGQADLKSNRSPGDNVVAGPGGTPAGPSPAAGPTGYLKPQDKIAPPNITPGARNPEELKVYGEKRSKEVDEASKWVEDSGNAQSILNNVENSRQAVLKGKQIYQGKFDELLGDVGNLAVGALPRSIGGGTTTKAYDQTEYFKSQVGTLSNAVAKAIGGSRATNFDLTVARDQMPNVGDSPEVRLKKLDTIEKNIKDQLAISSFVKQAVDQGYTVAGAKQAYQQWKEDQDKQAQGQVAPRPTQAGSAPALPATAAASGRAPLPPGTEDMPGRGGNGIFSAEFAQDLGRSALQLPKTLGVQPGQAFLTPPPSTLAAGKDTVSNLVHGTGELLGLSDREKDMARVAEQEQRRKTDPTYNQARALTDVTLNPTNYIAPEAGLVKTMGMAGLHGMTQPAEDLGSQLTEGVKEGAFGAAGYGVSKLAPTTKLAAEINIGGEGDKLLQKFPSFKPSQSQAAGKAMVSGGDAVAQSKAITKDLMQKGRIEGEQITPEAITKAKTDMGTEYDNLLPRGQKLRVSTTDLNTVGQILTNPEVANAVAGQPTLRALTQLSTGGNARAFSAADLHEAWKEIGNTKMPVQAATQLRQTLAGVIEKNVKPADVGKFRQLNEAYGTTQDIERIFSAGGGEGKGATSGFLRPSAIAREAGRGPISSSTDDAARLINKFNVQDAVAGGGVDIPGAVIAAKTGHVSSAAKALNVGNLPNKIPTMLGASPTTKHIVEGLRAGAARGPVSTFGGNNAPEQ
jgi:Transglycosylase SLT domain